MKQFFKSIRDRIQRTLFDQELAVLGILAANGSWMTYVEVAFNSSHKVSTDNALATLDALSIEREPEAWLVDRGFERDGVVGLFFRINDKGRRWLESR